MKTYRFDKIIHAPNRLQICAFLVQLEEAEFQLLRAELAVSDSVLSKHIKSLEEAGYVAVVKRRDFGHRRTWVSLTAAGSPTEIPGEVGPQRADHQPAATKIRKILS